MASPPDAALTDYERLREENIRRNDAILASLRRKAAELSAAIQSPSTSKRFKKQPQPRASPAAPAIPVVLRRSLRTRGLPPSGSSSSPPAPASPPAAPRSTRFSSSLASVILAAAAASPAESPPVRDDGFDAGTELVLRPSHVRRVVPDRILSVRILPLVDRTVVAAGNKLGNVGFWDVDGVVADEDDGDGADGVFEYLPHRGPVGAIVSHPTAPQKEPTPPGYPPSGSYPVMALGHDNLVTEPLTIASDAKRVLHITVSNLRYPVTEGLLHRVFYVYGAEKIYMHQMRTRVEASVKFHSRADVEYAREAFHGRNIYDGYCWMDIQLELPSPAATSSSSLLPATPLPLIIMELKADI